MGYRIECRHGSIVRFLAGMLIDLGVGFIDCVLLGSIWIVWRNIERFGSWVFSGGHERHTNLLSWISLIKYSLKFCDWKHK